MTKAERLEAQKARLEEMLKYERELWASGCRYIAGVDEVGRGPLAGPVVTAAVILPEDFDLLGVDDSKKLTPKKRDELFEKIKEAAVCWAVGRREPGRIDEINILNATKEAMLDAVNGLSVRPDHVLIDAVKLPSLEIPQTSLIHREMEEMAKIWPGYSFEKNKGYGTKAHYEGLKALGPCPIHRKTFL